MTPDVTVLIPFLNGGREDWLRDSIASFPVGTPVIVARNDGEMAEAFNQALGMVDTEYVMLFAADDIAHPRMLERLTDAIADADVAYPGMILVDEHLAKPVGVHGAQQFCPRRLLQQNYITGSCLVRREAIVAAGGYRSDLEAWEDWDLWVRMAKQGARFKPVVDAAFFYRQVPGSRNRKDSVDWEDLKSRIVGDTDPNTDALATFYSGATPVTAYVRCVLPARHLPGIARFDPGVLELVNGAGELMWDFPMHRGAAVMQFAAGKMGALALGYLRDNGHRVLVETDDNYVANADAASFRKRAQWGKTIGERADSVEGHKWIVREADGVIVSTDYLASRYRKFNPNVYVCPNQVDPVDWPALEKPDDGVLRIGWFASPSHAGDGKLVRRAVEWAARQKDVEVVAMGYDPRWNVRHRRIPWTNDQSVYRHNMQTLDIGLCPVVPSEFALGRSDLKWLEYSMSGAAAIVSDNAPYASVPDGLAVKVPDAAGFYHAVKRLVADRDEVKALAAAAREYVMKERTMAANIWRWQQAVEG